MRILYLLQDFPYPPTNGIKWKIYNLLSYMAQRHECHVLSFGETVTAERIAKLCDLFRGVRVLGVFPQLDGRQLKFQQIRHLLNGTPPSLARWDSQNFAMAVHQALDYYDYDIVHHDVVNMAQYRPLTRDLPGILSTNDAMMMRYMRKAQSARMPIDKVFYAFLARRFASYETKMLREFTMLHVVSPVDGTYIAQHNPDIRNIEVVSLCVEPGYLEIPVRSTTSNDFKESKVFLFTSGSLRNPDIAEPLLRFVRGGFNQIRSLWPEIKLLVLGRNAPERVATILRAEPGVQFESWVDDYIQSLGTADIAIFLDQSGSGIKTRVLQALAAAKPVVGTTIAMEGIQVTNGIHAYICQSLDEVTEAVLELLGDVDLRVKLGRAARKLVQQHYTQEITGRQWESLYQHAVEAVNH